MKLNLEANCIDMKTVRVPLSLKLDSVKLRLIVDRCSVEIFADDGKFCATFPVLCDYNLPYLKITAEKPVRIRRLDCSRLKSIHASDENVGC